MVDHNTRSERINIFGLEILSTTFQDAVNALSTDVYNRNGICKVVVTPNVDHIVKLDRDPALQKEYAGADYIFPDGFPLVLASQLMGKGLRQRITGADLFAALCQVLAEQRGHAFVLGGRPGEEDYIRSTLVARYPGLKISAMCPTFGFDPNGAEAEDAVQRISETHPDVVFVCLGFPKQDLFGLRNRERLQAGVVLGVGAALDFALGRVRRAPVFVQSVGMEWLWRLVSDPIRLWRRYLVEDVAFLSILVQELANSKR